MKFKYHFQQQKGWMNDPNGFCYYKGKYHVFFQHTPFSVESKEKSWGHAVSDDMITWEELPTAIWPEHDYENQGGCFSGSAIEKDGNLHLFYTGSSNDYGQCQATAMSTDGITFVKDPNNPIMVGAQGDEVSKSFRDPKVFYAFSSYYMVVGYGRGSRGSVLLYKSPDLKSWTYVNELFWSDEFCGTLECPDMYPLGDKWVLMCSAMEPTVATTLFVIGDFDGENFVKEKVYYSEYGKDFYAPQTLLTPEGERVMIAWFYHWGKPLAEGETTAGALSIPRELTYKDGKVYNFPIKAVRKYMVKECEYVKIDGLKITIIGLNGNVVYEKDYTGILEKIEKVDILFDEKTVEVFINDGEISIAQWLI